MDKYTQLKNKLERLIRIKEKQTSIIYVDEILDIINEVENARDSGTK